MASRLSGGLDCKAPPGLLDCLRIDYGHGLAQEKCMLAGLALQFPSHTVGGQTLRFLLETAKYLCCDPNAASFEKNKPDSPSSPIPTKTPTWS